jgi:hypothetical protein
LTKIKILTLNEGFLHFLSRFVSHVTSLKKIWNIGRLLLVAKKQQ